MLSCSRPVTLSCRLPVLRLWTRPRTADAECVATLVQCPMQARTKELLPCLLSLYGDVVATLRTPELLAEFKALVGARWIGVTAGALWL